MPAARQRLAAWPGQRIGGSAYFLILNSGAATFGVVKNRNGEDRGGTAAGVSESDSPVSVRNCKVWYDSKPPGDCMSPRRV